MTYDKHTVTVAGQQYVRETTRWPGHKHSVYVPVMYPQDLQTMQGLFTLFLLVVAVLLFYGVFDADKKHNKK